MSANLPVDEAVWPNLTNSKGLNLGSKPISPRICAVGTRGSFSDFLPTAGGSLRELETHLVIACRLGYLPASGPMTHCFKASMSWQKCCSGMREKHRFDLARTTPPDPDCRQAHSQGTAGFASAAYRLLITDYRLHSRSITDSFSPTHLTMRDLY